MRPSRFDSVAPRAQWLAGLLLLLVFTGASRPAIFVALSAFAAGTALDAANSPRRPGRVVETALLLLAASWAAVDLAGGSNDLLSAVAILLLGIQSVIFLRSKGPVESWRLFGLSLLELLASAASTDDPRFAVALLVYVFLSVAGLFALYRLAESDRTGLSTSQTDSGATRFALASTAGVLAVATVLFLVIPRIGIGHLARRGDRSEGVTGFGETISMRAVTSAKFDQRVVARVEFTGLPAGTDPKDLYLRGASYVSFDGTTWRRGGSNAHRLLRSMFTWYATPFPTRGPFATAEIALEPDGETALFVYDRPVLFTGSLGEVTTDGAGSYAFASPDRAVVRYSVQFVPAGGPDLVVAPSPRSLFLEIPPGNDCVASLAIRLVEGAATDREKAAKIAAHFSTGFRYSISDTSKDAGDLLFEKRAGWCEHYATATVLLLRAAGIPARVGAGYLGGEWSDVGRYLIVRQSDAHAWAEGWVGGRWVRFDTTPAAEGPSPFTVRTGLVGLLLDGLRQKWNKYVVNYSLTLQREGIRSGFRTLRSLGGIFGGQGTTGVRTGDGFRVPRGAALTAALLAFVAVGASLLVRRKRLSKDKIHAPPRPVRRLVRALERRGHRHAPGDPLGTMLARAVDAGSTDAEEAERFLDLYWRDRFGAGALRPEEALEVRRLAGTLATRMSRDGAV